MTLIPIPRAYTPACLPFLDVPCGIFRWVVLYTGVFIGVHKKVRGDDCIEKRKQKKGGLAERKRKDFALGK